MKSPEQMGGLPENQPNKEEIMENNEGKEHKTMTPEEAAEMTRQRRMEYGLGEVRELTSEETKELEESIGELLERLDEYNYDDFSPEVQEEWYWVNQEVYAGQDIELIKTRVERFLKLLQEETKKS